MKKEQKHGAAIFLDRHASETPIGPSTFKDISERKKFEEALRISEEKYSTIFNCSPDPICLYNLDERLYVEVNDAWLQKMGYERQEVIGRSASELNLLEENDRHLIIDRACEKEKIRNMEIKFYSKNGEPLIGLFSSEVIEMNGRRYLLSVTKDITKRKKAEEALRVAEDKFARAFEAIPMGMAITRLNDGKFIAVNNSVCQLLGFSKDELMTKTSQDIGFWIKTPVREPIIERIKGQKPVREIEIVYCHKDGEMRTGSYSAEGIYINGELCLLSMISDISDRKKTEADIRYLSFHDKLTGLYNRAYFETQLQRMANSGQMPLTLMIGDVNGLKLINDTLGHQEGDRLLIDVAGILKKFCRPQDMIARWGGDEFIILMPNCGAHTAGQIADHIRTASRHLNDMPIRSSLSLGLATMTSYHQDIREVIKEAEDKMYRNKLLDDRSNRSSFLISLEQTLWSRSNETEEHCRRLQEMTQRIGMAVALSPSELDDLRLLSLLHDIGKIAIPSSILDKPGKLTHEEWESIKKHPEIGYRIALSSPEMAPIADAILQHHERWDGTGYPLGIKGKDIPLMSRIIAIADAFDVMINGRPYQAPLTKAKAWQEIERCAGSQFDPELVVIARYLF